MNDHNVRTDRASIFDQLSKKYWIALSVIAAIILLSQWLIQGHLSKQVNDSRVINVAGRQRMLSQKISKQVLKIKEAPSIADGRMLSKELAETLELWMASHQGLIKGNQELELPKGNSQDIEKMFEAVEIPFQQMVSGCQFIIAAFGKHGEGVDDLSLAIQKVLDHESAFLNGMDAIVFQYDFEAKRKVENLRKMEFFLLFVALGALALELFFIFRPTAFYVQKNINELMSAKLDAQQKTQESIQLYEEKEKSVQELRALNYTLDQAALFASTTLNGELIYMSDKLTKFLGYKMSKPVGKFADILSQNEGEQDYLTQIIKTPRSAIWTGEVPITTLEKKKCWLELSIVPVNRSGVRQDYLILCNDITAIKETTVQLERVSKERIDEEIRLQKIRSSQVVEAQEKERERIAKDMHDGIGQMLTALKFNLESLNLDNQEKLQSKIDGLKDLSANLIKGVRIATFNLTPPELTDYGIATALAKLCKELRRLTAQNILFENKTSEELRYDSVVETNIYRITQEAVNNAIKYANANYILITLDKTDDLLSVKIDDDGKGFDPDQVKRQGKGDNSAHMGLAFMEERVKFIFGRLFIRSAEGQGTRITINVPVGEATKSKKVK